MFKRMQKIHHSIFMKMVSILLLIGFIVLLAVVLFYKSIMGDRFERIAQKNIENYARYIVNDIGVPPDTIRAKKIAQQYYFHIRYESSAFFWATSPEIPAASEISNEEQFSYKTRPGMGWMRHRYFIIDNADGSQFVLTPDIGSSSQHHQEVFFGLLVLLTVIFLVAFFLFRHVLKPIRWLDTGVKKIGMGDLNHRIPEGKKDELGDLTRAFNTMTQRIRKMIYARDQLLMDVSHELRSPITRIKVALEFLPDSKNKTYIDNDINEIELMITEILESERLKGEHGQLLLEKTGITELIRDTAKLFDNCPPGIILQLPDAPVELTLDYKRMQIVIKNLLDNACKYSKEGSAPVKVKLDKMPDIIKLTITDDGIGIPEEEIPYLFEPFYRVDRSRSKKSGGYGLGLNLCRKIVEAHGGVITIANNPGGGTVVAITLPVKSEKN
jgi:signal transduction histidine kinase